jgi:hypothetical protein
MAPQQFYRLLLGPLSVTAAKLLFNADGALIARIAGRP